MRSNRFAWILSIIIVIMALTFSACINTSPPPTAVPDEEGEVVEEEEAEEAEEEEAEEAEEEEAE
ncbi:MAG: hypothetical protein HC884_06405, partial [Chloroflexaceae bacterium]|nr:hypothetical protein [Chloroflexaceae bacterium]